MNKMQIPWDEIREELNTQLSLCKLTNSELAQASGAGYFAIRRFRISGVHNQSGNVNKLCIFFKIHTKKTIKVQNTGFDKLVYELGTVWDGSDSHAQLLTKLIRSTKTFKINDRSRT